MGIANGGDAFARYLTFLTGTLTPDEAVRMFVDLTAYCTQDTLAMIVLLDVLKKYANG